LTGLVINAIAQGFIFIPALPEAIESVYQKKELIEGEDDTLDGVLNDKAAALYGLSYAIGAIIAPLSGSLVNDYYDNWRSTCDVFALVAGTFSAIFLVLNVLPDIHKEKQIK